MTSIPRPGGRSLWAFAGVFSVTFLALFSVGIVLPVLPLYIRGPLGAGDFAVGFLIGAFAFTGLAGRPIAGYLADTRGRRLVAMIGCSLAAVAGILYFVPGGIPTLLLSRLVLGAGEGMVFTAGAAWVVDLAPEDRRGRIIGLYGLSVWTALSAGRRSETSSIAPWTSRRSGRWRRWSRSPPRSSPIGFRRAFAPNTRPSAGR